MGLAMDIDGTGGYLKRISATRWQIDPRGKMRVPAIIHASETLLRDMDDKVREQLVNVTTLPGIVGAAHAMPDAHWGYGFPIGGVAAFDADRGRGHLRRRRRLRHFLRRAHAPDRLRRADIEDCRQALADALFAHIPAGVGSEGDIRLGQRDMEAMLAGGARWALEEGFGEARDLDYIEDRGHMEEAEPGRFRSGPASGSSARWARWARATTISKSRKWSNCSTRKRRVPSAWCRVNAWSRSIAARAASATRSAPSSCAKWPSPPAEYGIALPDRELACAPILSETGQRYIGAMRAAINCALANRQIIGHLVREVFDRFWPGRAQPLMFDVSHNTCKPELHEVEGQRRTLWVHRKGATRALGPGHESIPEVYREVGQPVLIGGSMGTGSWVLAGMAGSEAVAFSSACHGAGRSMSRNQARRRWHGRQVVDELAARGITIRSPSSRGVAEEAPGAYKDVAEVVLASERAGLARRVARLQPLICIKG
jgi:tRNA-splicing ligase RtcB (3'-phosphate/5'-hydroxy nucleic acid ligase)